MVKLVTPPMPEIQPDPEPPPVIAPEPPLRRKLPAYGRQLLMARRNGVHPQTIHVVYGDNWRGVPWPRLCMKPFSYVPGRYDWRVVAGVRVILIDRCRALLDCDREADRYSDIYALIGELVDAQAYVVVRRPDEDGQQWVDVNADTIATACRIVRDRRSVWPAWWSDEREAFQTRAFLDWMSDVIDLNPADGARGQEQ